jgi:hypothetical protein
MDEKVWTISGAVQEINLLAFESSIGFSLFSPPKQ